MLLNNIRPDIDDIFYFIYRFVVRSWLLFLFILFSVPIAEMFNFIFTAKQFLVMGGAFVLVVAVDFLSIWIKAHPLYKEQDRIEWENNGRRKTR